MTQYSFSHETKLLWHFGSCHISSLLAVNILVKFYPKEDLSSHSHQISKSRKIEFDNFLIHENTLKKHIRKIYSLKYWTILIKPHSNVRTVSTLCN